MRPIPFTTATHALGAPPNWDPEVMGECEVLYAEKVPDGTFYSIWVPSPEELAILNAGGGVRLGVLNDTHPVVNVSVTPLTYPDQDDAAQQD